MDDVSVEDLAFGKECEDARKDAAIEFFTEELNMRSCRNLQGFVRKTNVGHAIGPNDGLKTIHKASKNPKSRYTAVSAFSECCQGPQEGHCEFNMRS